MHWNRFSLPIVIAAVAAAGSARADVSWQQVLRVSGPLAVAGGGILQSSCRVSGDRQRCDLTAPPALWNTLRQHAAESESRIVRIDQGRIWSLQAAEGTVIEETFNERKARLDRLGRELGEGWPFDEVAVEIIPTKANEQIEGLDCEDVRVVIKGSLHPDAASKIPVSFEADVWVASAFPGRSQIDGFARREASALGVDPLQPLLAALIDPRYGAVVREFVRALGQVGGTPIRIGATLSGGRMGLVQSRIEEKRESTGSAGLVEMKPTGVGLVTRRDRSAPVTSRTRREGDWTIGMAVAALEEGAVDPAQFELPPGARKLVPKSRHTTEEPSKDPVAGGAPSQ